jgi:peptidoglycan/xylan/chitin deacetylase (PgdA/CDA1 family)
MKATVFLVSGCVGKTNAWDIAKGDVSETLMDVDRILDCHSRGTEFGAHTENHLDLRFCDLRVARDEVVSSKANLERMLNLPIDWFSYPYGGQGAREREMVKDAGFHGACATGKYLNTAATDPFALARINVRGNTSTAYLSYKISRAGKSTP